MVRETLIWRESSSKTMDRMAPGRLRLPTNRWWRRDAAPEISQQQATSGAAATMLGIDSSIVERRQTHTHT